MLYHLLKANLLVEQIQSGPQWEYEYALLKMVEQTHTSILANIDFAL